MIFVVCHREAVSYPDEHLADKAVSMLNRARACGGSEHMVIMAESGRAAHQAYLTAFAEQPAPRTPYRE